MNNIEQFLDEFNSILLDLIKNIANVRPKSILGTNVSTIENIIKTNKNKKAYIDIFITKVLIYKDKIDNYN